MPLCCGALDGTLINVEAPREKDIVYVDRHGKHSLNAQGVCGPDYRFYSMSAKWPGSVNDSRVFKNSALCTKFDEGYRPFENTVIIGESIYPVKVFVAYASLSRARRFLCGIFIKYWQNNKSQKKSKVIIQHQEENLKKHEENSNLKDQMAKNILKDQKQKIDEQ